MSEYPRIHVEGGPLDRGRQYGEEARERVQRSVAGYSELFGRIAGTTWAEATARALTFERAIAGFGESYLEELRGIAEGAGLTLGDVLALNIRTEVLGAARARQARGECSAVAILPVANDSGETLIAQNWDWYAHVAETVVVLEARQDGGPDFVTIVEAGLLAKTGFNSAGLGLVTNALTTDADRCEPGVPYHVVLRAILDCETISDALAAVQRGRRPSSASYLVAHEDGMAVCVEAAPGDFSRLFLLFPEQSVLLHTNHFLAPAFDGTDVSIWSMPDSPFRLERLRARLGQRPLSVELVQEAFRDHANEPNGVCCHPDPRSEAFEQGLTAASLVMELDSRTLWLAQDPPCSASYEKLDYGDFLAKGSLRSGAARVSS
jgi:isopenicillin-N N-acyltransferase like protein